MYSVMTQKATIETRLKTLEEKMNTTIAIVNEICDSMEERQVSDNMVNIITKDQISNIRNNLAYIEDEL